MSWFDSLNAFLAENPWVLMVTLIAFVSIVVGLNIASFVHAYRGNRHPFPMSMSAANIVMSLMYIPYVLAFFKNGK